MKTLAYLVISAAIMLPKVFSATVEFTDGRRYNYTLLGEEKTFYWMTIDGMRVQIPRSMVREFSEKALPKTPPEPGKVVIRGEAFAEPAPVAVANEKAEGVPVNVSREPLPAPGESRTVSILPPQPNPEDLRRLRLAIDTFGLNDESQRLVARKLIADSGDLGLMELANYGLNHPDPNVRAMSALVLGDLGGRRVLKRLIEEYYSSAQINVPQYQVGFVHYLEQQIFKISGQNFAMQATDPNNTVEKATLAIRWWQQNWDKMPSQIGEPQIDPASATYLGDLKVLRELKLAKKEYAGSYIPLDVSTTFEQSQIPMSEHDISSSLTPTVPKIPSPARDAPGEWRKQQYLERLREGLPSR